MLIHFCIWSKSILVSIHDDNLKDGYGFPNIVEILKELKTMKINPVNQTPKKKRRFLWWEW
jgi:hypothetical protein